MNAEEMGRSLTRLKAVLTQWAPKEIDRDLCTIWLNVLKDFTDQQIREAFLKAASDLTEWPAPASIKRLCQGCNQSDEEIGRDIAAKIEESMGSVGPNRFLVRSEDLEKHRQKLLSRVGEIGMEVIRQCGGWNRICELEYDQIPAARKQWRETAAAISKNFYTGTSDKRALSSGEKKSNPALANILRIVGDEI